jgi:hypothetical protein
MLLQDALRRGSTSLTTALGLISTTWQGIPWWVGLVVLIPLLFYAVVRAGYEEYRVATEPHTESDAAAKVPQPHPNREVERLRKQLRSAEQERDRYRALLADPTAKRRREEEMLRTRCVDMARDVHSFRDALRYDPYHPDTVERFKRRHYGKVTELREELDSRDWLTEEERESLTLSEGDGADKIERMEQVLVSIGTGH